MPCGEAHSDSDWDILILVDSSNAVAALGIRDVVANRIFYAAFHTVSALLINDHIEVRSHKGAGLMFGQKYVIPRHRSGQWLYGHGGEQQDNRPFQKTAVLWKGHIGSPVF
ncbi:MAG: hypothetical protein IJQ35_10280 [Bacteroidales bacterium]|nr:hypothetical protein [Bacteroidales bacterium]